MDTRDSGRWSSATRVEPGGEEVDLDSDLDMDPEVEWDTGGVGTLPGKGKANEPPAHKSSKKQKAKGKSKGSGKNGWYTSVGPFRPTRYYAPLPYMLLLSGL